MYLELDINKIPYTYNILLRNLQNTLDQADMVDVELKEGINE